MPENTTRRDVLRMASAISIGSVGATGVTAASAGNSSVASTADSSSSWTFKDSTGEISGQSVGTRQSTGLTLNRAEFRERTRDDGTTEQYWEYDFRLATTAVARGYGDPDSKEPVIQKQSLSVERASGKMDISRHTGSDDFGIYPNSSSTVDYSTAVQTLFETTLGSLHDGVSFAIAAGKIVEQMANTGDASSSTEGYSASHNYCGGILPSGCEQTDVCHYTRFEVDHWTERTGGIPLVDVSTGTSSTTASGDLGTNVSFEIDLLSGGDPSIDTASATTGEVSFGDPREMSAAAKKAFGIERVSDNSERAQTQGTEDEALFVAHSPPVSVNVVSE